MVVMAAELSRNKHLFQSLKSEIKDFRRSEAVRAFCHREKPEQGVKTQKLPFDKHLWQKYLGKFP